jgi:hypothetical protein
METREVILDKAYEYLAWLTQPHKAFSDMAVCPFVEPEIKREHLYIAIWYPSQKSFMKCMEDFYMSDKNSALFVCPNTQDIDWSQVERKTIQAQITSLLKNTPMFSDYKSLCFSPWEDFTAGGGIHTRKKAPYFMINVASRTHLAQSHKQLQKSSYFANFTDEELGRLKAKDILKKK